MTLNFVLPFAGAVVVGQVHVSSLEDHVWSCHAQVLAFSRLVRLFHHSLTMPPLSISLVLHELSILLLALIDIYGHFQLIHVLLSRRGIPSALPHQSILRALLVIQSSLFK